MDSWSLKLRRVSTSCSVSVSGVLSRSRAHSSRVKVRNRERGGAARSVMGGGDAAASMAVTTRKCQSPPQGARGQVSEMPGVGSGLENEGGWGQVLGRQVADSARV